MWCVCVCVCRWPRSSARRKQASLTVSSPLCLSAACKSTSLKLHVSTFFLCPGMFVGAWKCGAKRVLCERNKRVYIQYLTRLPSILILLLVWSHTLQEQKWGHPPVMLPYAVCCLEHKCWRMCVSVHVGACVCLFSWETKAEEEKSQRNPPVIGQEP